MTLVVLFSRNIRKLDAEPCLLSAKIDETVTPILVKFCNQCLRTITFDLIPSLFQTHSKHLYRLHSSVFPPPALMPKLKETQILGVVPVQEAIYNLTLTWNTVELLGDEIPAFLRKSYRSLTWNSLSNRIYHGKMST